MLPDSTVIVRGCDRVGTGSCLIKAKAKGQECYMRFPPHPKLHSNNFGFAIWKLIIRSNLQ